MGDQTVLQGEAAASGGGSLTPMTARRPGDMRLFTGFALLVGSLHVIVFFVFAPAAQVLRPHSDMFGLIEEYLRAEASGDWFGYLAQPHSYHRLPWFRSLIALDLGMFKGTGIPLLVSAFLCLGATAAILVRSAMATPTNLRVAAAAFILMIVLNTANVVHVSVPANTPYSHALFFAVLAIALAEPTDGSFRATLSWRRIGALAAACAAVLSLAAGAVVWAVLAFIAWRRGEADRRWLIVILATGGVFFSIYVSGLSVEDSAGELGVQSLIKGALYFISFLGLPWARGTPELGRLIGCLMLGFSMYVLARKGGPEAPHQERFAVALVALSLGVALLAAAGRQDIGDEVIVPGRYNLWLVPMKVGLLLILLPWLKRQWTVRPHRVEASLMLAFSLYFAQQVWVGETVARSAAQLRETITDFQVGVRTESMKTLIYPDLSKAEALQNEFYARGLFASRYSMALKKRGLELARGSTTAH